MTVSTSRAAYADCFGYFDQALSSNIGIRVSRESRGEATYLRTRLHYARTLSRNETREVYSPDDPHWGVSPYDSLVCRIREDAHGWWVYIEPVRAEGEVQELAAE